MLTAARNAGTCVLLALLASCALTKLDDPRALTPGDVVTLTSALASIAADGVSRTQVIATVHGDTPDGADVVFKTNVGAFAGTDAQKAITTKVGAGQAIAVFISDTRAGIASISATVGGVTAGLDVALFTARPTEIILVPDKLSAKANGTETIHLVANLFRPDTAGIVSRGARVDLVVVDSASGNESTDLRQALNVGDVGNQVTFALLSRTALTYLVTASVGSGTARTASNTVHVTFVP